MSGGRGRRTRFATGLVIAGASLAVCLVVMVLGLGPDPEPSLGPDTFSASGLGHSALVALLRQHGVAVIVSRWDSSERAREGAALVVAEPDPDLDLSGGRRGLRAMVVSAKRVLLVAPKRQAGSPAPDRPRWMRDQRPLDVAHVNRVFDAWGLEVLRPRAGVEAPEWQLAAGWPAPTLVDPPQLFGPFDALVPLVSQASGVLLGRLETTRPDQTVLVLSDPDVLANHGLGQGANAAFALKLVEELRGGTGSVIWDETWHDHLAPTSAARLLLRPPLGYASATLLLLSLLALWSGAVRFGGAQAAAPPLKPGKAFLVENTADLLRVGGHSDHVLRRYLEVAEREAAERLHAGRAEPRAAREDVAALARARGLSAPSELHAEVERATAGPRRDARAIVAAGARIHRWREELTHGRRRGS